MANMTIEEKLADQEFDRVLAVKSQEIAAQAAGLLKTYIKVTFQDGGFCICDPKDVPDMTEGANGYKTEEVQMTEREFEALPEFQG
jgi:hypothetical protein